MTKTWQIVKGRAHTLRSITLVNPICRLYIACRLRRLAYITCLKTPTHACCWVLSPPSLAHPSPFNLPFPSKALVNASSHDKKTFCNCLTVVLWQSYLCRPTNHCLSYYLKWFDSIQIFQNPVGWKNIFGWYIDYRCWIGFFCFPSTPSCPLLCQLLYNPCPRRLSSVPSSVAFLSLFLFSSSLAFDLLTLFSPKNHDATHVPTISSV